MKKAGLIILTFMVVLLAGCAQGTVKKVITTPAVVTVKTQSKSVPDSQNEVVTVKNLKKGVVYYTGKAIVLTYHHISNVPFSGITITPQRFESDLKMLLQNNFNVITLRQLINAMNGTYKLPPNAVVITFDDGIESFYKYAFPMLKKYNLSATNFVITSRTESYHPSINDFNPLSPAEIKEMYKSGLVDIQSHTNNSHDMVYINSKLQQGGKLAYRIYDKSTGKLESQQAYVQRITQDLAASRNVINKYINVYPDMLCFPFGQYNNTVISAAKSVGFKYFITTQPGANKQNSKSEFVFRISAGEAKINTNDVYKKILKYAK